MRIVLLGVEGDTRNVPRSADGRLMRLIRRQSELVTANIMRLWLRPISPRTRRHRTATPPPHRFQPLQSASGGSVAEWLACWMLDSGTEGPGFKKSQPQVTWVINPAVGCHYFPPGLQLPPQPLRGLLPILLLGEQRHNGCEQFV